MSDPTTPAKGFAQPQIGGDSDDWGNTLNADLTLIDSALGGTASIAISGNTTLTTTQAANTGYTFTGTLAEPATIIWPAFFGIIAITNNTTGGQSVTCGISGGQTVVPLCGETIVAWSNGTDFLQLSRTGGAIPIASCDGSAAGYVAKSGPGFLYEVRVYWAPDDGYLMLFDAADVPADGTVEPAMCVPFQAGSYSIGGGIFEGGSPMPFSNGIVIVFSTTGPFTKTGLPGALLSWRIQ